MISFQVIISNYSLKNEAPSVIKSQQVLSSLSFSSDVKIFLRSGPFSTLMVLQPYTQQKERIGFVTIETLILIPMGVLHLKIFLISCTVILENLFILNIRFKNKIVVVLVMF